MYADDTTIYFNIEDFDSQNTEADINAELEKVNTWLKHNKLSLNAQKTKLMLFHRKQKHVNDVNNKIDNTMIEHVQTFNFLGIMLNETLSWKSHIDMVSVIQCYWITDTDKYGIEIHSVTWSKF